MTSKKNPTSLPLPFALALAITVLLPSASQAHRKERFMETGKLVEMQDVPCGSRQKGLAGVGNIFASVGVTDVNAKDKLCQEYVLRTANEEYRIRPVDEKHLSLLPVGSEGQFRIKKDVILLSVPEGDGKVREYKVVAMKPLNGAENEAPASASGIESREGSSAPVGTWTATLKNSPSSGDPEGPAPGAVNSNAAATTTPDPTAAGSHPAAPDSREYQPASGPSAQYQLGMSLEEKGDVDGAVSAFRKMVEAKPDDARAHAALAGALERRGDSAGALDEYSVALKLDPNDPAVRANYDRLVRTMSDSSGSGS